jgi:hypothetical protein
MGLITWITPPQLHISFDVWLRAGYPPISTVGLPGAHGAESNGMQGIGVKTPRAAAVAAATCGLDGQLHIPKTGMFTNGLLSMIVARGVLLITLFAGSTIKVPGAAPKEHCKTEFPQIHIPIHSSFFKRSNLFTVPFTSV